MVVENNKIYINPSSKSVVVMVNTNIYSLEVIFSAAYVFIDKAYIILDGEPTKEIAVEIRPKVVSSNLEDLDKIAREFYNELLNYSFYNRQSQRTSQLRQTFLQAALITGSSPIEENEEESSSTWSSEEDPEGIAVPWEEKYSNSDNPEKVECSDCQEDSCESSNVETDLSEQNIEKTEF